ncbi:MAG: ABC transporter ATP-binding protein [Cyclobacteriaceae bacterium]|nr:ABC transporter ATP-binding protein [Cyclobacteriaceae bacterium]
MLEGKGLFKSYGALTVLKGVDIHVQKGEIVSIVGASGAGKSTLLHILGTLDNPDKGKLSINGQEVVSFSSKELSKFRNEEIGFIFQFHNLLPEFSVMENICIPAWIGKKDDREIKKRAGELIDILGIQDRKEHKPGELSGGEQQRTAVARALINNPSIIFADEPSGNLDSANARDLHQLFFTLRDTLNQTFVIVTHNEELAEMADRRLEIKDGVIL